MDEGYYTFLASLLHLEVANYNLIFEGLCISNHLTHYKSLKIKRESKYAAVQKQDESE